MPTITKSIGISSRDYSTIIAWEADLDNGAIYSSGDIAVGECYDDADFDIVGNLTIDGGLTIGLSSVTLTSNSGSRHTGIAGTGARLVYAAARSITVSPEKVPYTIEWLEFDCNNKGCNFISFPGTGVDGNSSIDRNFRNNIVHDNIGSSNTNLGITFGYDGPLNVTNNIFYDMNYQFNSISYIFYLGISGGVINIYNNTIHGNNNTNTNGSAGLIGIRVQSSSTTGVIRNNVVTDITTSGGGSVACFDSTVGTQTRSNNASSDATAWGTSSLTSISSANQYVSTVEGSEDLRLKAGADLINAGYDPGTSPTSVNIDINGYDRDSSGVVWDIGAHEAIILTNILQSFILNNSWTNSNIFNKILNIDYDDSIELIWILDNTHKIWRIIER